MIELLSIALMLWMPPPPTLPSEGATPLGEYLGCIMEPASGRVAAGLPADDRSREEIVRAILSDCAALRVRVAAQAASAIANMRGYDDPQIRRTNIEGFLSSWDGSLRSMIVDYEEFVAASDAFCRQRGERPGC